MSALHAACWPADRLGEALHALAQQAGLKPRALPEGGVPGSVQHALGDDLPRWVAWAGERLGVEAEAVDTPVADTDALLQQAGPALLQGQRGEQTVFLLLLGRRGRQLRLLGPDLREHCLPQADVRQWLCARLEAPRLPAIQALLDKAGVPPRRRAAATRALLAEQLHGRTLAGCWLLRPLARGPFWQQLVQARVPRRVGAMLAVFAVAYAMEIEAWRLIGGAALDGRLDMGWLAAWALLMLSLVPLRWLGGTLDTGFALEAARILKQRLLTGALRVDLDLARQQGAGQWLSRVMEAQALESLALGGGLATLVALLELGFAAWVLSHGAAPLAHLALLGTWVLITAGMAWRFHGRLGAWTGQRLRMTHDLIEQMQGHRTRLAQERTARRDAAEDRASGEYLQASQRLDRALLPVVALVPAAWLVLGLVLLAPALSAGRVAAAGLAISLGGLLFAHRALHGVAGGLSALSRAAVAWQQVAVLFKAGGADVADTPFFSSALPQAAGSAGPLLQADALAFRHAGQDRAVLQGLDLEIHRGDRVLLQGASGSGKSTLAALLTGLRAPTQGTLLLAGLDRDTLGPHWQRLATEAPQFHDNHILQGTLAFNLLLGREGPHTAADLDEAQQLCSELGLAPLLSRMPAGLHQYVGETGWQLSHGEKSRVFLARALLQKAPLTVLDESFAALDPQTLRQCLATAVRRSQALVVVAHP
jgi:ATP-binding cassette, subfamily B, bacterial